MSTCTFDFTAKAALVTGAGSGIGRATAKALAAAGARLVIADIDLPAVKQVEEEITSDQGTCHAVHLDVSDDEAVRDAVRTTVDRYDRLDIAINNAGIFGDVTPLIDYPLEVYRRTMRVNVDGVFHGLRHEIPVMLAAGGGVIVNTCSVVAHTTLPKCSAYNTSKHAVLGLTRSAAAEYAGQGIRITAVSPGLIDTALGADAPPEFLDWVATLQPIGRIGTPDEVAALICFLASDSAALITGRDHLIDGGWRAA
jgi:NAD(P)-dependent dehydrogenase (short-subunit alcohol dehydrogenase family)